MEFHTDQQVEASFVGLMLHNPIAFAATVDRHRITVDNFVDPLHRLVFETGLPLIAESGIPPDERLLTVKLADKLTTADVVKLGELSRDACLGGQANYYANELRERTARRQIARVAPLIVKALTDGNFDAAEDFADTIRIEIAKAQAEVQSTSLASVLDRFAKADRDREQGKSAHVQLTGFSELEGATGGLRAGELLAIAGATSGGKSAFMRCLATAIASTGVPVGIVSIEDPEATWASRFLADASDCEVRDVRHGTLNADGWRRITQAQNPLRRMRVRLECLPSSSSTAEVLAAMRRAAMDGARFLFVDYLQAIRNNDRRGRHIELGEACARIKGEGTRLGCAVVLGSQVNRESLKDDKPSLYSLKETGDVENIAEAVGVLWCRKRHDKDHERDCIDLHLLKSKNGNRRVIQLEWWPEFTRYQERRPPAPIVPIHRAETSKE